MFGAVGASKAVAVGALGSLGGFREVEGSCFRVVFAGDSGALLKCSGVESLESVGLLR